VQYGAVANSDTFTNAKLMFIGDVEQATILNVAICANTDFINIATNDGLKP
jgi:hypothetical protein